MADKHVRGLKRGVPVPLECAILNVPFGNTTVSTLLPGWSTPPAVNTPLAMMLDGALLATVAFTSWKNSVPELPAAWLALATVKPVAASAPAIATTPTPARILLLSFIMVIPPVHRQLPSRGHPPPSGRPPGGRARPAHPRAPTTF